MLSSRIHKEKLATHSFRTHLLENTPGVLGAAIHNIAKLLPLLLGLTAVDRTASIGRRGGHIVTGLICLSLLLISGSVAVDVHGDNLREVTIGVVSQVIRISQDRLHRIVASSQDIHLLSLIDQKIFERAGILIQDAGSFNPEVINDLGGYGAYARLRGRRSLRGNLGL